MADKTDKKDTAKTASIFWPTLTAPSKIDSIELDIVIEQEHKLESEVTEHPVEDGFSQRPSERYGKSKMVCGLGVFEWMD